MGVVVYKNTYNDIFLCYLNEFLHLRWHVVLALLHDRQVLSQLCSNVHLLQVGLEAGKVGQHRSLVGDVRNGRIWIHQDLQK